MIWIYVSFLLRNMITTSGCAAWRDTTATRWILGLGAKTPPTKLEIQLDPTELHDGYRPHLQKTLIVLVSFVGLNCLKPTWIDFWLARLKRALVPASGPGREKAKTAKREAAPMGGKMNWWPGRPSDTNPKVPPFIFFSEQATTGVQKSELYLYLTSKQAFFSQASENLRRFLDMDVVQSPLDQEFDWTKTLW